MASSSHKGAAGGSMGSTEMSIDEKRQHVYELSKDSKRAFKNGLQEWPCEDIRQVLRVESGKERKYTGLTKNEIIDKVYKAVSKKNTGDREVESMNSSPKRQRKDLDPLHDVTPSANTQDMSGGIVNRLGCANDEKSLYSSALKGIECLPLPSKFQGSSSHQDEEAAASCLDLLRNSTNCSNSEGKRVNTITDSDVIQIKKNNSCEEQQLVPEENRSDELNNREVRPENANKLENVESCSSFEFEKCVKLIRQLECSGNIKSEFRQKFLTWYSLRATAKEKYIVKTFIDTFKEDTAALAEQLIDTFSDCISRKRPANDGGI